MKMNGINGANTQMWQMGMNQAANSYSRNIQNQIAAAQRQLQELSSDKNLTQEEKTAKRQELQQRISDLNVRLRQHQMEQRREKQHIIEGNQKTGTEDTGALVSLSTTNKQIAVMKKVRTDLQGKLRVVRTEEERAELQEKIDNVTQNMCGKAKETWDTISEHQRAEQDKTQDKKEDEKEDKL